MKNQLRPYEKLVNLYTLKIYFTLSISIHIKVKYIFNVYRYTLNFSIKDAMEACYI